MSPKRRQFYAYAALGTWDNGLFRLFGAGLGNMLLPWARSVVFARQHDLLPIWPTWLQIKLGPWLRAEPDKRHYLRLFHPTDDYVHGLHKLALLPSLPRIPAPGPGWAGELESLGSNGGIVVFSGMTGRFATIAEDHRLVRAELLAITRDVHKRAAERPLPGAVAVHIRLGDFSSPQDCTLRAGRANMRVPLRWYVDTIDSLRRRLNRLEPVSLFSDGSDEELEEVLRLPEVHRVHGGSAIADMLALSRSALLIASSVFSQWASYLGRMPVIWHPGQLKHRLYAGSDGALEIERDYGQDFSDEFIAAFCSRRADFERVTLP